MTDSPKVLTIMGSGETSPTMVKTHRENMARFKNKKPLAVILDTPFGFQENADDIALKAIGYFKVSVNVDIELASFRSQSIDPLDKEKFYSRLDQADFVFAGPGSPTYALRTWRETPVAKILASKLIKGPGVVTFSSAAALTLGSHTVPVYEIYKVGLDPVWEEGLDLLGALDINGAIIPHFNNAEGGNHDTRFCYLGQNRLEIMEKTLGDNESIFGIDEHTAIVIDLEAQSVKVVGNGLFTLRNQGRQVIFESGSQLPLDSLRNVGSLFPSRKEGSSRDVESQSSVKAQELDAKAIGPKTTSPLLEIVENLQKSFSDALTQKDVDGAVKAALSLQQEIDQWQAETFQSDEMDQAKVALRGMIVRLGEFASKGTTDPNELFGPFVELALGLRLRAREEKRWKESDEIRDELARLGIEVRDIPGGTEWIPIGNS